MAKTALFFKIIFKYCPNGCIPNLKLQAALKASHLNDAIFYHNQEIDGWATEASTSIRQVARFFRMIKVSLEQQQITLKKAVGMNLL